MPARVRWKYPLLLLLLLFLILLILLILLLLIRFYSKNSLTGVVRRAGNQNDQECRVRGEKDSVLSRLRQRVGPKEERKGDPAASKNAV